MIRVADDSFPMIMKAFLLVAADNGLINRTMPAAEVYFVPERAGRSEKKLQEIEACLAALSDEDFENLGCGESDDQAAVVLAHEDAIFAHALITDYFNGGYDSWCDAPSERTVS